VRKLCSLLLAATLSGTLVAALPSGPAVAATSARKIAYSSWDSGRALKTGDLRGAVVDHGRLVVTDRGAGTRSLGGRTYDKGVWTSPWRTPGFGFTELIPSWDASTPGRSVVEVSVRGRTGDGRRSSWDVVGRWSAGDTYFKRTSVPGQGDDLADVAVDTWKVDSSAGLSTWQVRVTLLRGAGTHGPRVDAVGAVASRLPGADDVATSAPGPGSGTTLRLPRYSQMIHQGHYPKWGGGGEAWCSPTSTTMVLGYYDALPPKSAYDWVPSGHPNPFVDYGARATYDHAYDGTGNWPFNTAYAATRTGHAFVTRLRNLREAGRFIEAGIPLVASIAFGPGELDGAPISSTNGHLVVIAGFTLSGDAVVNDPAADRNRGVRRVYDRGQFEDAWLPKSGGLVYVITDADHPLPGGTHSNW
jgi:hypothetical protein